jgi:hypothetical protein
MGATQKPSPFSFPDKYRERAQKVPRSGFDTLSLYSKGEGRVRVSGLHCPYYFRFVLKVAPKLEDEATIAQSFPIIAGCPAS